MRANEITFQRGDTNEGDLEVSYDRKHPSICIDISCSGSSVSIDIDDLNWLIACLSRISEEHRREDV